MPKQRTRRPPKSPHEKRPNQSVADKLALLTESALRLQAERLQPSTPSWAKGLRPVAGSNPLDIRRVGNSPAPINQRPKPKPHAIAVKHGGTLPAKLFLRRGQVTCLKCRQIVRQLPTCGICCTHLLAGPFPAPLREMAPAPRYEQRSVPPQDRAVDLQ